MIVAVNNPHAAARSEVIAAGLQHVRVLASPAGRDGLLAASAPARDIGWHGRFLRDVVDMLTGTAIELPGDMGQRHAA